MLTTRRTSPTASGCAPARRAEQDRADRHAVAAGHLQHVEQDVGRIQVGQHQQVGGAAAAWCRAGSCGAPPRTAPHRPASRRRTRCRVRALRTARAPRACGAPKALDEPKIECDRKATLGGRPKRRTSAAAIARCRPVPRRSGSSLTKVSAMNSVCWSSISAFIAAITCARRDGRPMTCARGPGAVEAADQAAQHRVGLAAAQHQRRDQRVGAPHRRLGRLGRDALAPHQLVVGLPVGAEARVVLGVDDLEVAAGASRRPARSMRIFGSPRAGRPGSAAPGLRPAPPARRAARARPRPRRRPRGRALACAPWPRRTPGA
jgi:hypothetical protein